MPVTDTLGVIEHRFPVPAVPAPGIIFHTTVSTRSVQVVFPHFTHFVYKHIDFLKIFECNVLLLINDT